MNYKIKYLKYKKKYLNLKKMDNNSYKYFTLNDEVIDEVIPKFPEKVKDKISREMIGSSIASFNKFNRKLLKQSRVNLERKLFKKSLIKIIPVILKLLLFILSTNT